MTCLNLIGLDKQGMTCLNLIGLDKQTMSLIASNYPPQNIILEAAFMMGFVKF